MREYAVLVSGRDCRSFSDLKTLTGCRSFSHSDFGNHTRKKTRSFNAARLLSTSVLIERIKILVVSCLVAKIPGGEMTSNRERCERHESCLLLHDFRLIYIHYS